MHNPKENLIYAVATSGHRQSYLDTLSELFSFEPISESMSFPVFRRLLAAERLLFATLDDNMMSFGMIAVVRSILGRPTAGLFLRAQKCFESDRWYYALKRHAFRALRWLPGLTIASITPFDVAPRHAEVAHCGVFDPQYWDLHDGEAIRRPGRTALSEEILARAGGRQILCAVGTLGANKGLALLAETLERYPDIAKSTLVVGAGRVAAESAALAARMTTAGAMIYDSFITDPELESLYGVADMIWVCYAPAYDQASGVFGRAMQFGVEPIVREGSMIAAFATLNGIDHLPVTYGDHEALAGLLRSRLGRSGPTKSSFQVARCILIGGWRRQFVRTISGALGVTPFGKRGDREGHVTENESYQRGRTDSC
ncbi:hypothetical protein NKI63_02575 [Mesorhizobium sp. M0410]|uniref:hypothetical protein n=1 Tax=Mesorhizobium sp. M0410 TaxID=2956943 RepID=UPI0033392AD0